MELSESELNLKVLNSLENAEEEEYLKAGVLSVLCFHTYNQLKRLMSKSGSKLPKTWKMHEGVSNVTFKQILSAIPLSE